jgi:flagellar biosynthesis chaperone FliJ
MKKFKYSLDILIRVRDANKSKIQFRLGEIQQAVNRHQGQIDYDLKQINLSLESQNTTLQQGLKANQMQAVPIFVFSKRANIKLHKEAIEKLEEEKKGLLERLKIIKNEIKVYNDMKDREYKKHKKKLLKKQEQKLEEIHLMFQNREKEP